MITYQAIKEKGRVPWVHDEQENSSEDSHYFTEKTLEDEEKP